MKLIKKYQTPSGKMTTSDYVSEEELNRQKALQSLDKAKEDFILQNVQSKDGTIYRNPQIPGKQDNPHLGKLNEGVPPREFQPLDLIGLAPLLVGGAIAVGGMAPGATAAVGNTVANGIRTGIQAGTTFFTPSSWLNPVTGAKLLSPGVGSVADATIKGLFTADGIAGLWDQIQNGKVFSDFGNTLTYGLEALPVLELLSNAGKLVRIARVAKPSAGVFFENGLPNGYDANVDAALYQRLHSSAPITSMQEVSPQLAYRTPAAYTRFNFEDLIEMAKAEFTNQLTARGFDPNMARIYAGFEFPTYDYENYRKAQGLFLKKLYGVAQDDRPLATGRLTPSEKQWAMKEIIEREALKQQDPEAYRALASSILDNVPVLRPQLRDLQATGFNAGGAYIPYDYRIPGISNLGLLQIPQNYSGISHHEIKHLLEYLLKPSGQHYDELVKLLSKYLPEEEVGPLITTSRDQAYKILKQLKGVDVSALPVEQQNKYLKGLPLMSDRGLSTVEGAFTGIPEGLRISDTIENSRSMSIPEKDALHKRIFSALRKAWQTMGVGILGVAGASSANNGNSDNEL